MNAAHTHLILNHIPVLGSIFGALLLLIGILRGNKTLIQTSLITFIIAAAVTLPVDWSGEEAEHLVEEIPGLSHDVIHEHEEMAEVSVGLMLGLGGLSLATLILSMLNISLAKIFNYLSLVLAFVVIGFMGRTANSGALIRHPEIKADYQIPSEEAKPDGDTSQHSEEHGSDDD